MTNISHIDQAIILLRERLRNVRKQAGSAASATVNVKVQSRSAQPAEQLRRLLAIESLPPRELRRALIRNLLTEALGDTVANDLSFQDVANRVTAMLDEDDETRSILDRAIAELKSSE